jgi:hypothetical protein
MNAKTMTRATHLSAALALALLAPAALAQTLPAAGTTNGNSYTLPGSRVTAEEHSWVIRMLSYHPGPVVPGRMYTASCRTSGSVHKVFASITAKTTSGTKHGMVLSADVASDGVLSNVSSQSFAECKEMNGIVASSDCSTVTAMCRKPSSAGSTGATRDLVAALPNDSTGNQWRDALTAEPTDDWMWLYEWKGAPATPTSTTASNKFIVSKAIGGGWEYGHQNLVMTTTHYGVAMKGTTGLIEGLKHQGDSFVAVTRPTLMPSHTAIDTTRGWMWACARGHTLANRPVANTKFGAFCTTDWTGVANDTKGAVWMRVEGQSAAKTRDIYASLVDPVLTELRFNGGSGSILPDVNGGFIGVFVGSPNPASAERSQIGLMRFNSNGAPLSTTPLWIKSSATHFLSYPQLVSLGNDRAGRPRYLLGWAQMMASGTNVTNSFNNPSPDNTQRLATKYFVQEIEANGTLKSQVRELTHGWGEQDQMTSAGPGKAAWVHRPDGRIKLSADGTTVTSLPSPNSTQLMFMTYTSTSM